jgi:hypothetical protein
MLKQHFLERSVPIRLAGFQVHGLSEQVANDYLGTEVLMCRLWTAKMEGDEEGSTT